MKLVEDILNDMKKVSKPQKKFLLKAIQAFLSVGGKMTFKNMCRYVGLSERTFSRQFSKIFSFGDFNHALIERILTGKNRKLAAVFDPFFVPKSGNHTYGKGKFWSGSSGRVEPGLEASLLSIVDLEDGTAYALGAKQTPSTKELHEMATMGTEITRIDWFLQYICSMIGIFPAGIRHLLVDAYFFKEKFVTGICNAGLHVIGKMRKDARLLALYSGPQKPRGRHKKFNGAIDFDKLPITATNEPGITLRSTVAYSVSLKRAVLVVMVRKQLPKGRIMEALLFSTDTTLEPIEVYEYYKSRFQIEFVIRDAKQYTGLTHCQSWVKERIDFHINLSFLAVNVAKIKELERLGGARNYAAFSIATQHVRHHNEMLIQSFFEMLGLDILEFKSHPGYEQALAYGVVHV